MALLTIHVNIRQKIHLNALHAIALAGLAPAARHVKAEPSRFIASNFGFRQSSKKISNRSKQAGVCGGVGTRRAADGRLVDINHFINIFKTLDFLVLAGNVFGVVKMAR